MTGMLSRCDMTGIPNASSFFSAFRRSSFFLSFIFFHSSCNLPLGHCQQCHGFRSIRGAPVGGGGADGVVQCDGRSRGGARRMDSGLRQQHVKGGETHSMDDPS